MVAGKRRPGEESVYFFFNRFFIFVFFFLFRQSLDTSQPAAAAVLGTAQPRRGCTQSTYGEGRVRASWSLAVKFRAGTRA